MSIGVVNTPTIEKLGKYQIRRVLGKGAMGVVYEGFDPGIERVVAIKTIHKALLEGEGGQELLARFKREAQAAGRLMHQNIVAVYEYGEDMGIPFIAMEFVKGKELKDLMKDKVRLDINQVVSVMTQILDAMQYVHSNGVVHRDMKPANIVLLENGQVKVADFGIARVESSNLTQMGSVMGTPSYMSPEQFMGQRVDARADLFSIAVILYELLTGEKPFPGQAVATIMQKVLNAPVEDPTNLNYDVPPSFNAVIKKGLAKRPAERFQSAREFADALRAAAQNRYVEAPAMGMEATLLPGGSDDSEATSMMSAPPPGPSPFAAPAPSASRVASPPPHYAQGGGATMVLPQGGQPGMAPGMPQMIPQGSSLGPHPAAPPPFDSGRPVGLLVGVGVVVLAMVGGAVWYFTRGEDVQESKTVSPVVQEKPSPAVQPAKPPTATVTGKPSPAATAKQGEKVPVNLVSKPPGAMVLLNTVPMGYTPAKFELNPGEYQMVLKKDGFHNVEANLDLEPGGKVDLVLNLDPL